jgi:hypothetical protein
MAENISRFNKPKKRNLFLIVVTSRQQHVRINAELILKLGAHVRYRNEQRQGQSIAHDNKKSSIIIT